MSNEKYEDFYCLEICELNHFSWMRICYRVFGIPLEPMRVTTPFT
jgi:hypothetical protein